MLGSVIYVPNFFYLVYLKFLPYCEEKIDTGCKSQKGELQFV